MATPIPITLCGNNLGERHHHLNSLVNDSYQQGLPFESVENLPEHTVIDRLYKIDLASKYRHVQYIVNNLKDDNILYVSRALRCTWLLESQYRNIINPGYLEDRLYPDMLTTAVNKMKHWIYIKLRDVERCHEFYLYYSSNIDVALKFLWNCSTDFISKAAVNILDKITPHHMKLLCEKCPQVIRIYFEMLPTNQKLLSIYLSNEHKYYHSLKSLLKAEAELFLDITEKYYNNNKFKRFSPTATLYIMNNHRCRFYDKPELYTAMLLDMKTLAKCLSAPEVKNIVLKLARAKYLDSWFSYKNLEPLITRLPQDERSSFKNLVFVDKSVGELINEWPYSPPCPPEMQISQNHNHMFIDNDEERSLKSVKKRKLIKRKGKHQMITLDELFDVYRFSSFKKTFIKLSKKMQAESSSQIREYMMLVLVSKSGGNPENIGELLELLLKCHANEPPHVRSAVVRSMVKRANVWQMPITIWQMFLKFAQGLGLDGTKSDVNCDEGLHAVVLRHILSSSNCPPEVFTKFLEKFSTFTEYKLNSTEKKCVAEKLPEMLLPSSDVEPTQAVTQLQKLLDVLNDYHIRPDKYPGVLPMIVSLTHQNLPICRELLNRLFLSRIARKELFQENFSYIKNNASYLNALRHDTSILMKNNIFCELVKSKIHHDSFLRKLSVYFSEQGGIAENYLAVIESQCATRFHADLARSVALLAGPSIYTRLKKLERNTIIQKQYATALWTNVHLAIPKFNLDDIAWNEADVKAIANKILICRTNKIGEYIDKLMMEGRTVKLGLMLASRSGQEGVIFSKAITMRPILSIKYALKYMRHQGDVFDRRIWETVKPVIAELDLQKHKKLQDSLLQVQMIPLIIRVEYCAILYRVVRKVGKNTAIRVIRSLKSLLGDVDEEIIIEIVEDFINNELAIDNISNEETFDMTITKIYLWVIVKYLLLCRNEELQKRRMTLIGEPLLNKLKHLWQSPESVNRHTILRVLDYILLSLKYSKVFLDRAYVTSLPVFKRVAEWMQEMLPTMKYFNKYTKLHLTMLYCKSIRQCIKHKPDIFSDPERTLNEGVVIVGSTFGKYLAYEIKDLTKRYFDSIVEIYSHLMSDYFRQYFNYHKSRDVFIWSLLKGFLSECRHNESKLLALYIYEEFKTNKDSGESKVYDMLKQIDDIEMRYCLNAIL
ncbi:uncharacterized protein LOC131848625 [Achroia grisella]|uniref:uncharacterized protein LOC131848625 n=1 Tax=Achroia grisella TaxID=688607 RepID=UPI0027D2FD07|nr:uncharacterized protein LOC131848625 [Achroia grisella]